LSLSVVDGENVVDRVLSTGSVVGAEHDLAKAYLRHQMRSASGVKPGRRNTAGSGIPVGFFFSLMSALQFCGRHKQA